VLEARNVVIYGGRADWAASMTATKLNISCGRFVD
jgi:hypothetical protein